MTKSKETEKGKKKKKKERERLWADGVIGQDSWGSWEPVSIFCKWKGHESLRVTLDEDVLVKFLEYILFQFYFILILIYLF